MRYGLVIVAILVLISIYLILEHTLLGPKIKFLETNPTALKSSGFDERKVTVSVATISSFIAGLASTMRLLGYDYRLSYSKTINKVS
ncbi:MAG: hypothetical protein QXL79_00790 [Sulfolobales archaeon]